MLAGFPPCAAVGDVVHLKDGTQIDGQVKKVADGWVVTTADGKNRIVAEEKVSSIEVKPRTGPDVASSRLASLRHATENATDLKSVIDRYKAFITQFDHTPAADAARAELVAWEERLDKGMVKVGDKWVTPEEKAGLQEKAAGSAKDILEMMQQGKLREAAPVLEQALAVNPQRGPVVPQGGHALPAGPDPGRPQGVRVGPERDARPRPDAEQPGRHPLAAERPAGALAFYDRALLASPADRFVLDNMAEALNALGEEHRKATATQKAVRHFNEQDRALAAKLEKEGLHRWGATWVSTEELAKLQKAEKEIADKLAEMSKEFDAVTIRLAKIDADIDSDERLARRMEADSVGFDSQGRQVRYPLPASYNDLGREVAGLRAERAQRLAQQEQMRRNAKLVQQRLPTPRYSGLQRIIDVEGTPLVGPVPPAPVPAPAAPPVGVVPAAPGPLAEPAPPRLPHPLRGLRFRNGR